MNAARGSMLGAITGFAVATGVASAPPMPPQGGKTPDGSGAINTDWTFGEVGGIDVDTRGRIWVIQRPWTVFGRELGAARRQSGCCRAAPPVIEFDAMGKVVQAWPPLQEFHAPPGTPAGQGFTIGGKGETRWEAVPDPRGYGAWGRREHTVYGSRASTCLFGLDRNDQRLRHLHRRRWHRPPPGSAWLP